MKQGWSGFSSGGCTAQAAGAAARGTATTEGAGTVNGSAAPSVGNDVDLVSEALHSTGTVGSGDRSIVAVYTLHPDGTSYGTAYSRLTTLVRSLDVPGAQRPSGIWFSTWGCG